MDLGGFSTSAKFVSGFALRGSDGISPLQRSPAPTPAHAIPADKGGATEPAVFVSLSQTARDLLANRGERLDSLRQNQRVKEKAPEQNESDDGFTAIENEGPPSSPTPEIAVPGTPYQTARGRGDDVIARTARNTALQGADPLPEVVRRPTKAGLSTSSPDADIVGHSDDVMRAKRQVGQKAQRQELQDIVGDGDDKLNEDSLSRIQAEALEIMLQVISFENQLLGYANGSSQPAMGTGESQTLQRTIAMPDLKEYKLFDGQSGTNIDDTAIRPGIISTGRFDAPGLGGYSNIGRQMSVPGLEGPQVAGLFERDNISDFSALKHIRDPDAAYLKTRAITSYRSAA